MKSFLPLLALALVVAAPACSQDNVAVPLDEAEDRGISIARLDSLHGPAAHADSLQSVFPGRQDEVFEAWRALLDEFSNHLLSEGFEWSQPLTAYFRFYFHPDGSIKRVLYKPLGLESKRAEKFGNALEGFAQSYQFALSANEGFAQCSPAQLMPPSE